MEKVFGKWDTEEIEIEDPGLKNYINLNPETPLHKQGKQVKEPPVRPSVHIVERLINTLMRGGTGRKISGKVIRHRGGTGKKSKMYKTVKETFEKIEEETGKNPIEILVKAIENAAPREETTMIERGGIKRHQAVDSSPKRRVDFAIRNIGKSVAINTYKSTKSTSEVLKDELIKASNNDSDSFAIAQKINVERVAQSSK